LILSKQGNRKERADLSQKQTEPAWFESRRPSRKKERGRVFKQRREGCVEKRITWGVPCKKSVTRSISRKGTGLLHFSPSQRGAGESRQAPGVVGLE